MRSWKSLALVVATLIIITGLALSVQDSNSDSRPSLRITITSPSLGEAFQGNTSCIIRYDIIGGTLNYTVELYYTIDSQTFNFIDYHNTTAEGAQQYNWTTPLLTNSTVRIRINVTDSSPSPATASNLSALFEIDSTPPSKPKPWPPPHDSIAVEGYPRAHEIKLNWSASGDDGNVGKPSYYHARCYDTTITEDNWDEIPPYWRINQSATVDAGGYESCIFNNLEYDKIHYFAIKAYDNVGLVSELSNCISIRTLKFEVWPDTIQGTPGVVWDPINKTVYLRADKTVTYTEVWMKGNLRVVNNAELKFEKVLFIMDCIEDFEYRIEIAPGGLIGYLEGGKFVLQYSNISASVIPTTGRWHPYLFLAYENSRFWMFYSSVHHCGGKPEDVENIELGVAQISIEVDVELGIEIRSSDVSIENSIVSQNWGIFLRSSLPMQASPTIKNNIISRNRYGMVIKPRINIGEQWPINLEVNNISNNGIGVYSDSARVGLEGCWFIGNTYGAVYNNTPLDWPHNVSGVIYHCVFENNALGINSLSSSLKLITSTFAENTEGIRCDESSLNITCRSIISDSFLGVNSTSSSITVRDSDVINNTKAADSYNEMYQTYFVCNGTYSTGMFGGIYCSGSSLDVEENSNISDNLNGITLVLTPLNITNSTLTQNQYIIIDDETGSPLIDDYGDIIWDGWGVYSEGSVTVNILDSNITNNEYGIISILSFLNIMRNNISYNADGVSYYGIGLLWAYGEANVTNNTFFGNDVAMYGLGNVEIPNVMQILTGSMVLFRNITTATIISRLMEMPENINVEGGVFNNTFIENGDGIYVVGGSLTLTKNYIKGVEDWSYNMLCVEADVELIDTHMNTGFIGIIYIDMRLEMVDSSISDIEVGLLSLAALYWKFPEEYGPVDWEELSSITLLNSTINNTGAAMMLGPKSLSIINSTISNSAGWWYGGYGISGMDIYDASAFISSTTISSVNMGDYVNCSITITDNSQFTGCTYSLHVTDSILTVTDSSFDWNDRGVYADQSEIYVEDNIFSNQSDAIYCTGSSSGEILNNWFMESSRTGITVVDSFLTIGTTGEGNHFLRDTMGIGCTRSSPNITDNTFSGSGVGIACWDDSSPDIVSNKFYNIAIQGVYSSDSSPSIVGNIFANISKAVECRDGSAVTLTNNTLVSNQYAVFSSSSSLLMENNYISINSYGVRCAASTISITGGSVSRNTYGMYVTSSLSVHINATTVSDNSYGAYFEKSLPYISNTTIVNNNMANDSYGIYFYRCPDPAVAGISVKIINTAVVNNTRDLNSSSSRTEVVNTTIGTTYLHDNSKIESINSTFAAISFTDTQSEFRIYFYLTVSVKWQTGEPVENGTVAVWNAYQQMVFSGLTDRNGTVQTKTLVQYLSISTNRIYQPYRINASIYDLYDNKTLLVNATSSVDVWNALWYIPLLIEPWTDEVGLSPASIYINGNDDFIVGQNGVVSGLGTQADPYIIENWDINASTANGIEIRNTDKYFIIKNCVIHDGYDPVNYIYNHGIHFDNVTNGNITNCNVHNNYAGIYLPDSPNNNITNCNVYNNSCGFYLWHSSNNNVTKCAVYNNDYGIYLDSSSNNNVINCTVYNNYDYGIYLDYSSNNNIINCAVYNNSYGIYQYYSSNNNIYIQQQYVQLYSIQHNATISDLTKPNVTINQIPFSLTNNKQLSLSGRAWDNIGIWKVQINVNNGTWADAALKVLNSTYVNYTVEWSGILQLTEGCNYIQARAVDTTRDLLNNTDTAAAGIIVLDTTAPSIELLSPKYNTTNQNSTWVVLRITGESLESVTLYINEFPEVFQLNETGAAVRNNTVALTEGMNAISISVSDKLGNENRTSVIIITVDQKAPSSLIIMPAYEYVNSISEVRVSATDDLSGVGCVKICIQKGSYYWTGSSWGMAETWLNVTSAEGYWRYYWSPLEDAEYTIFTSATDRAGNTEIPQSKKFVYDATKPFIELSVPANFTTESSSITISGRTEIGANVTYMDRLPVYVDENGNFNIFLELGDEIINNFTIYAEDRAGNTNQTVITIERIGKVQPPQPSAFVWVFVAAGIAVAVIAGVVLVKKPKKPARKPKKETATKDESREKIAETRYYS